MAMHLAPKAPSQSRRRFKAAGAAVLATAVLAGGFLALSATPSQAALGGPTTCDMHLTKVDGNGQALPGAVFTATGPETDLAAWQAAYSEARGADAGIAAAVAALEAAQAAQTAQAQADYELAFSTEHDRINSERLSMWTGSYGTAAEAMAAQATDWSSFKGAQLGDHIQWEAEYMAAQERAGDVADRDAPGLAEAARQASMEANQGPVDEASEAFATAQTAANAAARDSANAAVPPTTVTRTATSDADGKATITGGSIGIGPTDDCAAWTVVETQAPAGYQIAGDGSVNLAWGSQGVATATVVNELIPETPEVPPTTPPVEPTEPPTAPPVEPEEPVVETPAPVAPIKKTTQVVVTAAIGQSQISPAAGFMPRSHPSPLKGIDTMIQTTSRQHTRSGLSAKTGIRGVALGFSLTVMLAAGATGCSAPQPSPAAPTTSATSTTSSTPATAQTAPTPTAAFVCALPDVAGPDTPDSTVETLIPGAVDATGRTATAEAVTLKRDRTVLYGDAGGCTSIATMDRVSLSDETVLPILEKTEAGFALVMLPSRMNLPSSGGVVNGAAAWVYLPSVNVVPNVASAVLDISDRTVTLNTGEVLPVEALGDGADATPLGEFYVVSRYQPSMGGPSDQCYTVPISVLSAHSETLDEHFGGPGSIAVHDFTPECADIIGPSTPGCPVLSPENQAIFNAALPVGSVVTIQK